MSIKRVISGLIGFPIVALVLIFGNQIVIDIAFAIIAAMSFHEYSHAFKVSDKAKPLTWLGYLACVTIALIHVFPREYLMLIIGAVVPIAILLCFAQILITKMKTTIIDAAVTLFGICYIVIFLMFMPIIRTAENGVFLIWYVMFASWGTDIFAYVCGKLIGKHKFSKISPNKTIEGCVGGTIGAVIMLSLIHI
uniref:phosphatidate cytidylyltransferase n=1 Tax=Candidatus Merdicola sp. TaxID=3085652 RepID=UPI003FEF0306